jgi:hypothetical protein
VPDDDCVAFVAKPMTLSELQQAISRLDPQHRAGPGASRVTPAVGRDSPGPVKFER